MKDLETRIREAGEEAERKSGIKGDAIIFRIGALWMKSEIESSRPKTPEELKADGRRKALKEVVTLIGSNTQYWNFAEAFEKHFGLSPDEGEKK